MPWKKSDVDAHKKGLTDSQKDEWVKVANAALKKCEEDGGDDCDAVAIKAANAFVDQSSEISEFGVMTFSDLSARRDASEKAATLMGLVEDFMELMYNIVYADPSEVPDKATALQALSAEFVDLLAAAAQETEEIEVGRTDELDDIPGLTYDQRLAELEESDRGWDVADGEMVFVPRRR